MQTQNKISTITLYSPIPCSSKDLEGEKKGLLQIFLYEVSPAELIIQITGDKNARIPGQDEVISLSFSVDGSSKFLLRGNLCPYDQRNDLYSFKVAQSEEDLSRLGELLMLIRKDQHLTICQNLSDEADDTQSGFGDLEFLPKALPELNWDEIETDVEFLGRKFSAPILITGMTGGTLKGMEINRRLARAAAHFNIPMGIGSQRIALENPKYEEHLFSDIRKEAPEIFLIGNIGATFLLERPDWVEDLGRAIDMIGANAMAVHLNTVQELIQIEGNRKFRGLTDRITEAASRIRTPIIVKEVGSGIDPETACVLFKGGVAAIDVAGRGGSASWSYIEGLRQSSYRGKLLGESFKNWGIPTAYCLAALRRECPANKKTPLIASGGIRDGVDIAKAIGLGANLAGIGLPLLKAATVSEEKVFELIEVYIHGLRTVMLSTGSKTLSDLSRRLTLGPPLKSELPARLKVGI